MITYGLYNTNVFFFNLLQNYTKSLDFIIIKKIKNKFPYPGSSEIFDIKRKNLKVKIKKKKKIKTKTIIIKA